ncbi:MAG TPA: peptidylprolyl isomerase [Cytophagaceae bacterium]|nr:peptidylprolyl isomerase [Cytophagaceae bacterium]
MKHINFLLIASALLWAGCKSSQQTSVSKSSSTSKTSTASNQPVLAKFGDNNIYTPEFEYVYKKNNANTPDAYTSQSLKEYLDLYTNFRLKVKEAEVMGLDTTAAFKKELEGYRKQLAQPYLTEKGVTDQLCREAYERMKEEVNASHILIEVGPDADPKDTLIAYNKIVEIRQKAVAGEDFGKLAVQYSQDPSAKNNKGNLGYFTALQMVYPFEDAAYKTKVGEISNPVRTRFGYHILKVNNRRPSQGQVHVAHIMVRATSGLPVADSLAAKQKIDEIYKKLKSGEKWEAMVSQFSDDVNSKTHAGELPWFSTGRMIPSFEEASFKLVNPGDISEPVQTPYGWHIIKLLEKKKLETYEELEPTIKSKVAKDSRSELNKTVLLQRLKKEDNFVEYPKAVDAAISMADSTLIQGSFSKTTDEKTNQTLFTIKNEKYTTADFFAYVKTTQKPRKNISPAQYMRNLYKDYSNSKLLSYEENHLEEKYLDYKMLVREYRDGILLFQLMDDKVWSKAIEDTAGLKKFFKENNNNYTWSTRAQATIYNVADQQTLDKLKQELGKDKFLVKEPNIQPVRFPANKVDLDSDLKKKINQAIGPMLKDKSMVLELGGGREFGEAASLSKARADSIKAYLVERAIDPHRIITKDLGKAAQRKTSAEKDADRQVTFTFYSTSKKALEAQFNEKTPLTLQVTDGLFQKGEQAILDSVEWKSGTYTIKQDGRINYIVINKIETARNKTFEEARGLAISDYQTYLEKEWIAELKKKYPVTVNEQELQKLIKK